MAFEVPPWEDGVEIIRFPSVPSVALGTATSSGQAKAKKLKKKKKTKGKKSKEEPKQQPRPRSTEYRQGKGPLAPSSDSDSSDTSDDDDSNEKMLAMHKVKSGRIEKQRTPAKAAKEQKKQLKIKPELVQEAVEAMETTPTPAPTPATLASKLQSELLGGRFRYINEQLYTMNSQKAEKLFSKDKEAFESYHAGYRQQLEKWPSNPLTRIIKTIKRLPKTDVIGDFGCGEGKLAEAVGHKVYSMDLVAIRDDIIACNITETPLKEQSLDVAVYCLSLMGTNLNDFLLEANRVLKLHGNVYIAEIQSRFEDVREFVRFMGACGFDLIKKDVAMNYFYFFHFRKMRHVGKDEKIKPFSLKPCLYRKR